MKVDAEIEVLSSRPYSFADKRTGEPVHVIEVVFRAEGSIYRTTKRGTEALEPGKYAVVIHIEPGPTLKPEIRTIEF